MANDIEKPKMLRHVMKWLTIGWTAFCLLGLGGCSLMSLVAASQTATSNDAGSAGAAFIMVLLFSIIMWFGVWIVGAIPCAVIWLVGKKNQ